MDPLSDILSLLKVEAILTARMEARGPWAMRFPSYKHIKFGTVLEGNFWLWMVGMQPLLLEKGDFYLLTSGDAYCCGSSPALMVSDGRQIFSSHREADGVVRYGQGELISEGIGGRFVFEEASSPLLLKHLPPVLVSRREESSSPALTALITLLSHETSALRPGHDIVASSMAILVLVQMLREYLEGNQKGTSWLKALGDRKIGTALSLIHSSPSADWTLASLSAKSAMSRSAFASRFHQLTGSTPGNYLTSWRMELACAELRKHHLRIREIARLTGYKSVPSFSLAFKRHTGRTPGGYRNLHKNT